MDNGRVHATGALSWGVLAVLRIPGEALGRHRGSTGEALGRHWGSTGKHWGSTGEELARMITLKPFAAVCDKMLEKSLGGGSLS